MQVKNYCKKNQIPAQDVVELLASQFGGTWLLTSQLNTQIIDFLNQNFGSVQPQLPQAKEQLQLSASESQSETITNGLATFEKTDLVKVIQEKSHTLTIADTQELQTQSQISELQEQAIHHAVDAFQSYQNTYEEVTRSLILKDIYQRNAERDQRRKEFETKEQARKTAQLNPETSHDAKTEILNLMKSDNYKTSYLNDILGGL